MGGVDDVNALIATDGQEIVIAGDDEIGLGGQSGGDDLIVIGVTHHARYQGWLHHLNDLPIKSQYRIGVCTNQREPPGRHGPGEHIRQLVQ
ncbi:MAG: hypothetical protein IPM75_03730 [Candidatus Competibacteraceae bacterium]|nr:hypothetical protein [Candidatus Competibacteraceae bacterium]